MAIKLNKTKKLIQIYRAFKHLFSGCLFCSDFISYYYHWCGIRRFVWRQWIIFTKIIWTMVMIIGNKMFFFFIPGTKQMSSSSSSSLSRHLVVFRSCRICLASGIYSFHSFIHSCWSFCFSSMINKTKKGDDNNE